MELYDVMHSTFSGRAYTSDPLPNDTIYRILDHARFAPSGGNRQGWRVIVVRDPATRQALAQLTEPAAKRYTAQVQNGENPWNTVDPPRWCS
jgi:nitroreductase